jgi:hypothetical protein
MCYTSLDSVASPGFGGWGANMESAEHEPIWGSGVKPPVGSRGKAPGHGVQGASPPEAESSSVFLKRSFR